MHDIARHQISGRQLDPASVTPGPCLERQPLLEQRECGVGAALLENSKRDIEKQQRCYQRRFDMFADRDLKDDCRLEHPGHGCPEMPHHLPKARLTFLGDFIRRLRAKPDKKIVDHQAAIPSS